jgi:hypothetical protein
MKPMPKPMMAMMKKKTRRYADGGEVEDDAESRGAFSASDSPVGPEPRMGSAMKEKVSSGGSLKEEFAKARKEGKKTFQFNGRTITTEYKEEADARKAGKSTASPVAKTTPKAVESVVKRPVSIASDETTKPKTTRTVEKVGRNFVAKETPVKDYTGGRTLGLNESVMKGKGYDTGFTTLASMREQKADKPDAKAAENKPKPMFVKRQDTPAVSVSDVIEKKAASRMSPERTAAADKRAEAARKLQGYAKGGVVKPKVVPIPKAAKPAKAVSKEPKIGKMGLGSKTLSQSKPMAAMAKGGAVAAMMKKDLKQDMAMGKAMKGGKAASIGASKMACGGMVKPKKMACGGMAKKGKK